MRVGFVGAGRMGAPMVARLLAAGHEVQVLARDPEKHAALRKSGASVSATAARIGAGAEVVVICVFTDEQVRAVCLDGDLLPAMSPGSVLVVHTTAGPHTMTAVAERAASYFVEVLDAPVSGGPHDIAAGTLTVFTGGADAAVRRARPALSCYADPVLHVGPLGSGQRVKLLNNAAFAAQLGVLTEIVRLADRFGLDEATVLRALPHGSAGGRALAGAAARGSIGEFATAVREFLAKDLAEIRATMAGLGADLGSLESLIGGLERAGRRRSPGSDAQ
ncbi:NAD(P)-dependent oxidoreductase [Nocardia goodfellowii]|uniref:3-hydroxyisobutyrate dehydrogenase-like beta-hydroxyacid dehydrogenase n=1 Tax=Nocardia goodfellowii TaxID=882446 RepID=A0ABS4QJU1_9NOCA|nr:NAD(P)-dependent oxidoreductase [Nocardia goodfellowii]MBP2191973.1 3-hydroxyisobutyrate dehydrogenase-like beta-hydroxyacid dehydrogenase [Nocardia goodfellowii]